MQKINLSKFFKQSGNMEMQVVICTVLMCSIRPAGDRPFRGRGGGGRGGRGGRGRGIGRSDGFDARGKREFDRHSGSDRS